MSDNPYSPSSAPASEYPAVTSSSLWHLHAAIGIMVIHAAISFVLLGLSSIATVRGQQPMVVYSIIKAIATSMLVLTAYLLYRRSKHAYIPVALYLLRAISVAIGSWILVQTYARQHPEIAQDFSFGSGSPLLYTMLISNLLPVLWGIVYTCYCLYLRKRRILS